MIWTIFGLLLITANCKSGFFNYCNLRFENDNYCRFLGPDWVITAYCGDFDAPQRRGHRLLLGCVSLPILGSQSKQNCVFLAKTFLRPLFQCIWCSRGYDTIKAHCKKWPDASRPPKFFGVHGPCPCCRGKETERTKFVHSRRTTSITKCNVFEINVAGTIEKVCMHLSTPRPPLQLLNDQSKWRTVTSP